MEEVETDFVSGERTSPNDSLEERLSSLEKEKRSLENDFGVKRAKFKELFIQKEDELKQERARVSASEARTSALEEESSGLKAELQRVSAELEGVRAAAAVVEDNRQDELSSAVTNYQQEVATLQQLLQEASETASDNTAARYETERSKLVSLNENYEEEIQDLRNKLSQERDGFLSTVARSIKKVSAVGSANTSLADEHENLEEDMKKAQEDAEMLKSVVVPLETEIKSLKARLQEAEKRLVQQGQNGVRVAGQSSPAHTKGETASLSELEVIDDPSEKVDQLMTYLKAEKAARTDLEMYVTVLSTQKGVYEEEADKATKELQDVLGMLESEKASHEALKQTWQMANDQFLESQRLMMMDLRRMEGVLSQEQQRQIAELQQKDEEREAQEKKVKDLEQKRVKQEQEEEKRKRRENESIKSPPTLASPQTSPNTDSMTSSEASSQGEATSFLDSGVHESLTEADRGLGGSRDGLTAVRVSPEKILNLPSLTQAQLKSITDPTPESEAHKSLLASARTSAAVDMEGRRLVSEREWGLLQEEMRASRDKLGRPCPMCSNYEAQLQTVQETLSTTTGEVKRLETALTSETQTNKNLVKYQEELEEALKNAAEDAQSQITTMTSKLLECEKNVQEFKGQMLNTHTHLREHCDRLTSGREEVQKQLHVIQAENDNLVGKHSKTAEQLQNEDINLPNNLEEMQLLLLKYREEIISAKVAKEHSEETLRSEVIFLKSQVVGEQQEKSTLEETLSQEITGLQGKLSEVEAQKAGLVSATQEKVEVEGKLREVEHSLKLMQERSKEVVSRLTKRGEEGEKKKSKLELEVNTLKVKVQSLQVDLDNSEAVQRDFVKLSQSLQIQLEKLRQAETEVRWQDDDDIDDCGNCKQTFSVTRRKHHCRHCGRLFCSDCTNKSVPSGPNRRPAKVCDVCHTILVKDATPYFSTEPPPTPD